MVLFVHMFRASATILTLHLAAGRLDDPCVKDSWLKSVESQGFAKLCYLVADGANAGLEQFNIKIFNFEEEYELYFDNGTPQGAFSGSAPYGKTFETLTYASHRFKLRRPGQSEDVKVLTMDPNEKTIILGSLSEGHKFYEAYIDAATKLKHTNDYKARTGKDWLGFFGRKGPTLPYVGEGLDVGKIATATSSHGYWTCGVDAATCETTPINFSIQLLATAPRALVIKGMLSPEEADIVRGKAEPQLKDGQVGDPSRAFKSTTRTSKLTFLSYTDGVMDNLLHRFGELLQIPYEKLKRRAEPLQVVRYMVGEQYLPHYDAASRSADTRFLTLLTIFQPSPKGGCTSFPRAFDRKGLEVCLQKGDAVLFYSLLPDGNLDEDSVHSGMRVIEGVKWAGNIWVHDNPAFDEQEAKDLEL